MGLLEVSAIEKAFHPPAAASIDLVWREAEEGVRNLLHAPSTTTSEKNLFYFAAQK